MALLDDCQARVDSLIGQIVQCNASYRHISALYEGLNNDQDADLSGIGMNICFEGGTQVPLPLPDGRDQLLVYIGNAGNFLARELMRLWAELHEVTTMAFNHCIAVQQQNVAPANSQPQQPQPGQPVAHVPQSPPTVAIQSRAPRTVPIGPAGS